MQLTKELRSVLAGRQLNSRLQRVPPVVAAPATRIAQRGREVKANVIVSSKSERADHEIEKVLYTTEQLNEVLDELGRQIGSDYQGKNLLVLGVLRGGFMFTADLVRHIHPVPPVMEVDFFKVSSYGAGTESSGRVKLDDGFKLQSVQGKHVLVCEDIIDSGLTMSTLVKILREAGAMSVRVVALLDKRTRRKVTFDADYVGIQCPDEFVVGYGIDFAERYRWLPYIGVPKPEVIEAIKREHAKEKCERKAAEAAAKAAAAAAAATMSSNSPLTQKLKNGPRSASAAKSQSSSSSSSAQGSGSSHVASHGQAAGHGHGNGNGNSNSNGSVASSSGSAQAQAKPVAV